MSTKKVSDRIQKLKDKEDELEEKVKSENKKVNYETASDWLSDGMNTYLNALVALNNKLWTQDKVTTKLREKDFKVTVGGQEWSSQLGGTLILLFPFVIPICSFAAHEI